jgi:hypothetical protein
LLTFSSEILSRLLSKEIEIKIYQAVISPQLEPHIQQFNCRVHGSAAVGVIVSFLNSFKGFISLKSIL